MPRNHRTGSIPFFGAMAFRIGPNCRKADLRENTVSSFDQTGCGHARSGARMTNRLWNHYGFRKKPRAVPPTGRLLPKCIQIS